MSLYCKARRTLLLRPPQHHTWLGIGLGLWLGVGLGLGFGIHKARVRVRPQLHVPKQRWLSWRCLASASDRSAAEASLAMPALDGVITREHEAMPALDGVITREHEVPPWQCPPVCIAYGSMPPIPYGSMRALIGFANSRAKNGSVPG